MAYSVSLIMFLNIVFLVLYVFKSIGLMTMATNKDIENPWLAWIPITDLYIAGSIVEEMDIFGNRLDRLEFWLPVIVVCGFLLAPIPIIGWFFSLVMMLFFLLFTYNLFLIYSPRHATLYTLLSVLGIWSVLIFILRNRKPVR